ncbi:hypothetical protein, partial [Citrobacter europaeus]
GWMNDCPRRYAQKNAAYRSASLFIKPRFGGVFAFWAGWMNDCPRRYAQKNAAYRSASLFIRPRFGGFLLSGLLLRWVYHSYGVYFPLSNLYLTFIYALNFIYLRECLVGYFIFCDD